VAVLLIDLLAEGGIGFPGVAGTLWLLLAVGLFGCAQRGTVPFFRSWQDWVGWAGVAGAILLAAACYLTAYRPVLSCQGQLQTAERELQSAERAPERAAEHLKAAVEHLRAAASADPFSPEPWQRLASIELGQWLDAPGSSPFDRFASAMAQANRLAPNSASLWLASGDAYWRAAAALDGHRPSLRSGILGQAVAAYRQAVRLYPNSAQYRARLAEALLAAGVTAAFRQEAQSALRLDRATPHLDKKLPDDVRNRLMRGLRGGPVTAERSEESSQHGHFRQDSSLRSAVTRCAQQ
jgi:tetratricopeptide (TPR) repeat protein